MCVLQAELLVSPETRLACAQRTRGAAATAAGDRTYAPGQVEVFWTFVHEAPSAKAATIW